MDTKHFKDLFQDLYPYIIDNDVTDIKWNGRNLWIDHLKEGRYKSDVVLTEKYLGVLTSRIANEANQFFNSSSPHLQAEFGDMRFHAIHPFVTSDGHHILAIRKTPAIARLNEKIMLDTGYANLATITLLATLIKSHCSGIIIGDVGSGKTEFEKYLARYIPDNESCITVEDTLEMKLPQLYPNKDVSSVQISEDYPAVQAIRDSLRLLTKWLLIAEARGREISTILEGASTGCTVWSTIHTENTWEIPDRVVQMAGPDVDKASFEDSFHMFFDVGIKIKRDVTDKGIYRCIDQISFFAREGKENTCVIFMKNGKYTGEKIPKQIVEKIISSVPEKAINILKDNNFM